MSSSRETAEGERLDQWEHIPRSQTQLRFTCWRQWSLMDPNEEGDYTLLILKLQKIFTNGESPVLSFMGKLTKRKFYWKDIVCLPETLEKSKNSLKNLDTKKEQLGTGTRKGHWAATAPQNAGSYSLHCPQPWWQTPQTASAPGNWKWLLRCCSLIVSKY